MPFVLWSDRSGGVEDWSRYGSAVGTVSRPFSHLRQVHPQGSRPTPLVRALVVDAMEKLVTNVEERSGRKYAQRYLVADFVDLWQNRTPRYQGPRDVYVTRIQEDINCADGVVVISVHGAYSLVPRAVDPAVVEGAIRAIPRDQLMEFQRDGQGGGSVSIYVYNIIEQARSNPVVRDELRRGVERFYQLPQSDLRLQLADDYSRTLIEHIHEHGEIPVPGFDSGDYGISSFMAGVIRHVVVPELSRIVRQSDGVVQVVSIGHTDRATVRIPIPYVGCASVSGIPGRNIRYNGRPRACPTGRLRNNNELSFARGYEGAALLNQVFPSEISRRRVSLGYTGKGSSESLANQAGSRRIVYQITSASLRH